MRPNGSYIKKRKKKKKKKALFFLLKKKKKKKKGALTEAFLGRNVMLGEEHKGA
jgi:hypothetical protein